MTLQLLAGLLEETTSRSQHKPSRKGIGACTSLLALSKTTPPLTKEGAENAHSVSPTFFPQSSTEPHDTVLGAFIARSLRLVSAPPWQHASMHINVLEQVRVNKGNSISLRTTKSAGMVWKKTSWTLSQPLDTRRSRNKCSHLSRTSVTSATALSIKFNSMIVAMNAYHSRTKRFIIPSACRQLSQSGTTGK
ncbi:uncharacterized protein HD556DRAFT_567502 [Suillus plorans]|uniref:Uncharacterized protein n=1 Tax=Suillus plorans TaxID=116603 RepID=A0A9P7DFQ7_9AGAM|nr:uncharacterized protein HD556DRAFT_567502 [Suillus plorans]KAG1792345.1 hypothetical protein HD556DRAFT_567502 [Suillus plorans]